MLAPLQLGRAHLSAEILENPYMVEVLYKLQLGRAHLSAEIRRQRDNRLRTMAASIGPRSPERGNRFVCGKKLCHSYASIGPRSPERGNSPLANCCLPAGDSRRCESFHLLH